jgi:hypothetical protein
MRQPGYALLYECTVYLQAPTGKLTLFLHLILLQHSYVPEGFEDIPGLARWVAGQRQLLRYEPHRLSQDRKNKLDALGVTKDFVKPTGRLPDDDRWAAMLNKMIEFKEEFGPCRVPPGYKDTQLYLWGGGGNTASLDECHQHQNKSAHSKQSAYAATYFYRFL